MLIRIVTTTFLAVLGAAVIPLNAYAQPMQQGASATLTRQDSPNEKLEREKFQYQQLLEERKLEVERLKAWLTGGSILLPLALGAFTLYWQSRTASNLKDREARDAFELKAAEIMFAGDSTVATRNRAKALAVLFPGRFPENFGAAFEPTQFGGPRFDAKLEVFKAASGKVNTPAEVYDIWHAVFPGDKWIEPLVQKAPAKPPENAA